MRKGRERCSLVLNAASGWPRGVCGLLTCRRQLLERLRERANSIDGRIQVDGPWGGFGIAVPSLPQNTKYGITPVPKTSYQLILEHLYR